MFVFAVILTASLFLCWVPLVLILFFRVASFLHGRRTRSSAQQWARLHGFWQ